MIGAVRESMATLNESIQTLERLVAKADEYQRRYTIELMAHLCVRVQTQMGGSYSDTEVIDVFYGLCPSLTEQERDWYTVAYAEAQLKQQCNPDREEV